MSTNISKQKRNDLINKIKLIKNHIAAAKQDKNTGNLLTYLSELEKEINGKKYGLVFEEHEEEIDQKLKTHTPVLSEEKDLFIDNGGQMNFLIEGDNLPALKLLEKTHKGKIDLIYIDPPYNTGAKDWKYDNDYVDENDTFRHSKWLSMMKSRLIVAKRILKFDGVLVCAIDENEQAALGLLLEDVFGKDYQFDCITIVHNPRGVQGKNFSYTHEFAYFVHKAGKKNIGFRKISDNEIDWRNLRDNGGESLRSDAKNCFYPIFVKDNKIVGFGDVAKDNDFHPISATEKHGDQFWVYPIDIKGVERKWRYARQSVGKIINTLRVKNNKKRLEIEIGKNYGNYRTVWQNSKYDANEYGTKIVNSLVNNNSFNFPKSLWNVYDCLYASVGNKKKAIILDFFAGSGTTGHAVMTMNSEDDGNRKFILCTNNENGICKEITYERIKNAIIKEKHKSCLKYFKVEFVSVGEKLYYEYADQLLKHIRELVELENGINFEGNKKVKIILTDTELADFSENNPELKNCQKLYLGHDVLVSGVQEKLFKDNEIEINIIPDYYYKELES